jgi:hypothetical protein
MRGFKLQVLIVDDGMSGERDIDTELTKLWLQFIPDIMQKVSNRKSGDEDGYCKLSAEERRAATKSVRKNLRLSDFFNDCQWRVARESEWESVFDHLFPLEDKRGRALKSKFDTLLWFPCAKRVWITNASATVIKSSL